MSNNSGSDSLKGLGDRVITGSHGPPRARVDQRQSDAERGSVKSCVNCFGASIALLHAASVLVSVGELGSGTVPHRWAEIKRRQLCSKRSIT